MVRKISILKIYVNEIKNNISLIKSCLAKNQKYCFVAKANCYGFGVDLCKYVESDVDCFAVSSAKEFFELKKLVSKDIIILDPIYENITSCAKSGAILTVSNKESLEKLIKVCEKKKIKCKIFLALNTGMNRFGFSTKKQINEVFDIIKKTQNIVILGVFSHYYSGNTEKFVKLQNKKFNLLCDYISLKFRNNLIYHISATDASLNFTPNKSSKNSLVRIGMGNYTDKYFRTLELKSKVIEIQNLKAGESAGYGRIFIAEKPCVLAVVAIGYGDGIFRNIVQKGYVLINNVFCKIVASCMDAILVDATYARAKIGNDVTIIGRQNKNEIFICDLARWCDTIEYEIIVRLSNRIERKYIEEKPCRLSQENIEQEN